MSGFPELAQYPTLSMLADAVVRAWPRHEKYLHVNFSERTSDEQAFAEFLSGMITRVSGTSAEAIDKLAQDYRFISEQIMLPEELHFRRTGEYRLKTFQEAVDQVYGRMDYMSRYMSGLLISHAIWLNHLRCMKHYKESFLPSLPAGADHLEIGPGHGLLLSMAAAEPRVGSLTAWDVSEASLAACRHTISVLGGDRPVAFQQRDIFTDLSAEAGKFDSIVLSEVLEHLEQPRQALDVLYGLCRPGGKVWINVPANSPAPDHLYLLRHPDEAAELVRSAGFEIVNTANFAMSGTTLERALKDKLTISCVIVGRRPS